MANDLNICTLVGRLGDNPEIRTFPDGGKVAKIRIAVGSTWKDRNTGEKRERTEWIPVEFRLGLAGVVEQYLTKGARIAVSGPVRVRKYQAQDGTDRYATEVHATTMQMLDTRRDDGGERPAAKSDDARQYSEASGSRTRATTPVSDYDDDIPF